MSKHDAAYIARFSKRNRVSKNAKPRKIRKALRAATRHYEALLKRFY